MNVPPLTSTRSSNASNELVRILLYLRKNRAPQNKTRVRILETAVLLFARRGYAGTSMRQIAGAVGIKAASLYAHFPSGKEQMLVEGLREIFEDFLSFVVGGVNVEMGVERQLRSVVHQHVRWQLESTPKASAWDAAANGFGVADVLSPTHLEEIGTLQAMYHSYVEQLVAALRDDAAARDLALAVLSLCDQARRWHVSSGGRFDSVDEVSDFVWQLCSEIATRA